MLEANSPAIRAIQSYEQDESLLSEVLISVASWASLYTNSPASLVSHTLHRERKNLVML